MKNDKTYKKIPEDGGVEIDEDAILKMKQEDTRSKIAFYYVLGFIAIILYVLTLYWATKMPIDSLNNLLITISGILSAPLGFIIGYYFKSNT
ncbi:hypothetical protein ACFL0A_02370 [Patescibacteria group bacterium]